MAATVVDKGIATGASSGTSRTVSATLTAGSNTYLLVFVWNQTGNSFTGVTWNGGAMTSGAVNAPQFAFRSQFYYLAAPTTGTHDIVVSWSGADTSVGVAYVSLAGADQGAPDVEGYGAVNNLTTISKSVTTTTSSDLLVAGFAIQQGATFHTVGAGQTLETSSSAMGSANYYANITSKQTVASGSNSMSMSWTTAKPADALVVGIKAAAASPSGPANVKTWNGITQSTGVKTYNDLALASVATVNGIN